VDPSRRFFLRARVPAPAVQRPPGALPEAAFVQVCTRCQACVQACPEGVLRLGDGGFPQVDFSQAGCTLCGGCVRACAPAALKPPAAFSGWVVQAGAACLAAQGVACRLCGDGCDHAALRFPPRRGGVAVPVVQAQACTGCGQCLPLCPSRALSLLHSG
jgi:ferredoxin-type protein NapF